MSRILVTGGSGFIGSHFVDLALRNKDFVINLDKLTYASTRRTLSHNNYRQIRIGKIHLPQAFIIEKG